MFLFVHCFRNTANLKKNIYDYNKSVLILIMWRMRLRSSNKTIINIKVVLQIVQSNCTGGGLSVICGG